MDLTLVSRSVGKGDGFAMCVLWEGKTSLFRCLERPSEIRAIFEGEVETPDYTTLAYALRAGMNRSSMVLSSSGCHIQTGSGCSLAQPRCRCSARLIAPVVENL